MPTSRRLVSLTAARISQRGRLNSEAVKSELLTTFSTPRCIRPPPKYVDPEFGVWFPATLTTDNNATNNLCIILLPSGLTHTNAFNIPHRLKETQIIKFQGEDRETYTHKDEDARNDSV